MGFQRTSCCHGHARTSLPETNCGSQCRSSIHKHDIPREVETAALAHVAALVVAAAILWVSVWIARGDIPSGLAGEEHRIATPRVHYVLSAKRGHIADIDIIENVDLYGVV